ncbi:MAG: nucleoside hydrolase [Clostridia bacterium]|nr:nucleoside hydrolase [Clostridia bacterium]
MKKIIIDTDIGDDIDDAFALLAALADDDFEILGITTVFKNTAERTKIVKRILKLAGREGVPVFSGHDEPINGYIPKWDYENTEPDGKIRIHHYRDDMASERADEGSAEDFILSAAEKYPGEVTLIALGPLTNIAAAIKKDPKKFLLLKEARVMCGQFAGTYPEWNVRVDPEAADIFFTCGLKITSVGLDVTTKCKLYKEQTDALGKLSSPALDLVKQMMNVWIESNNGEGKPQRYPTMHDPLCVLCVSDGDICGFEEVKVAVTLGEGRRGYTETREDGSPVAVAKSINADKFYEKFFEAMKKISV